MAQVRQCLQQSWNCGEEYSGSRAIIPKSNNPTSRRTRWSLLQPGKSFAVSISTFIIIILLQNVILLILLHQFKCYQETGGEKPLNYFRIIESTERT